MTPRDTSLRLVILACAVSAGIHGALTPEHLAEGIGAGLGFLAATALLAALAVAMSLSPTSRATVAAAGAVLAGLIVSYGLAATTGMPVLHPEPEPVEGLAIVTKLVEAIGLLGAGYVLADTARVVVPRTHRPKGTLA